MCKGLPLNLVIEKRQLILLVTQAILLRFVNVTAGSRTLMQRKFRMPSGIRLNLLEGVIGRQQSAWRVG